jgi:hypothetical protein
MRLLDRVRDRLARTPRGDAWDDGSGEAITAMMAGSAAAYDPEPDDPRLAASRAAVLGAFAASTAGLAEPRRGTPGRDLPTTGRVPLFRWGGRRPALVLVAAGLLLVMGIGTVAASAPGGVLYGLRLASEELLLPESPGDRARAQVDRLDTRLAEASDAATRGDIDAAAAALRAYAKIATEASAGAGIDGATAASLTLKVRAQLEVISRLGTGDPALEGVRLQAQGAARALLGALGEPDGGGGSGPGPSGPAPTSPGGAPSMTSPASPSTPGGSGGPGGSGSPAQSGAPRGPNASPGGTAGPNTSPPPGGSTGPNASPYPGGTAGPNSSPGPQQTAGTSPDSTPTATPPGGSGAPSASPGPASGSGSGGSGSPASAGPSPTGQVASDPAASASPGEHR